MVFLKKKLSFKNERESRYRDIGALMKRCETLVVTRDEAREALAKSGEEIQRMEAGLVVFKEEQNERILELRYREYD